MATFTENANAAIDLAKATFPDLPPGLAVGVYVAFIAPDDAGEPKANIPGPTATTNLQWLTRHLP